MSLISFNDGIYIVVVLKSIESDPFDSYHPVDRIINPHSHCFHFRPPVFFEVKKVCEYIIFNFIHSVKKSQ